MAAKRKKKFNHPPGQSKRRKIIPTNENEQMDSEIEQDNEQIEEVNLFNSQININGNAGLPLSGNARASRIPVLQQALPLLNRQRAAHGARAAGNVQQNPPPRPPTSGRVTRGAQTPGNTQQNLRPLTRRQAARVAQTVGSTQQSPTPPTHQQAGRGVRASGIPHQDPPLPSKNQRGSRITGNEHQGGRGAQATAQGAVGDDLQVLSPLVPQQAVREGQGATRRLTARKEKTAAKDSTRPVRRRAKRGVQTKEAATNTADENQRSPSLPIRQQTARGPQTRTTSTQDLSSDEIEYLSECADDYDYIENPDEIQTHIGPLANSTDCHNRIQSSIDKNDPINRLANILSNSIANFQIESSMNSNFSKSKIVKKLPEFSGDPLEWLHFKQALDLSSELGQCSDRENRVKLFDSLKGDAREAAKSLFASGSSASEIMHTLELRFGNSQIILDKIVSSVKELPRVDSGKIDLIEFATKLKNAIAAIKSLNNIGYLHSPEFLKEILEKIPSSMLQDYARHVATGDNNKAPLEKLSDFVIHEAEIALKAGILNLKTSEPRKHASNRINRDTRTSRTSNQKVLLTTYTTENTQSESDKKENVRCDYCGMNKHSIQECRSFTREPMRERWKIVRRLELCYNCLQKGHNRRDCTIKKSCIQCERPHHTILHFSPKIEEVKKSKTRNPKRDGSSVKAFVAPSKPNLQTGNASMNNENSL